MVFTRKRRVSKTMKRSFKSKGRKRTYGKVRRTIKKGNYKRSRAVSRKRKHGALSHVTAPNMRLNVIPKTADRLHVKLNYKTRGLLDWRGTAERHIGLALLPTYLGVNSVSHGPYSVVWPTAGTNVNFPSSVSTTPGFLTLVSRFTQYYVSSVSLTIKVTRQDAADSTTCIIGMMPLTPAQFTRLVVRNTGLSPTANVSQWLPMNGATSSTTATTSIYEQQLMTIKQQPYVKMRTLSSNVSGHQVASLHQRYSAKKFCDFGFPYGDGFQGTLPVTTADDGSPPNKGFQHYFFMHDTGPGNGDAKYDIDMDLTVHATFHRPIFMQNAPLYVPPMTTDGDEEKKDDAIADDTEDLVDTSDSLSLQGLSLATPRGTCLNPAHPAAIHERKSTCV